MVRLPETQSGLSTYVSQTEKCPTIQPETPHISQPKPIQPSILPEIAYIQGHQKKASWISIQTSIFPWLTVKNLVKVHSSTPTQILSVTLSDPF